MTDTRDYRIRKICVEGTVSTVVGTGRRGYRDGKVEEAQLGDCYGVAVGEDGTIYFSDYYTHVIRVVKDGEVTTLAGKGGERGKVDGKGDQARFNNPCGICVSSDGCLLVADSGNCSVRKVTMDGVVTTLVGNDWGDRDGDLSQAQFKGLDGICTNGEDIYVTDWGANSVKKISEGRVVSLKVQRPRGVCFFNGSLFTSSDTHRIYIGEKMEPIAGSGEKGHRDGNPMEAAFSAPSGLVGSKGSLYVADRENYCFRRITLLVEWSPDTHQRAPKRTRDAVRTLMLMRMRSGTVWNGVPKDVAFLIFSMLHQLSWASDDGGQRIKEQHPAKLCIIS